MSFFDDITKLCNDLKSAMEAARLASGAIETGLAHWLRTVLATREAPTNPELAQTFWCQHVVDASSIDVFGSIDPYWSNGCMWVNPVWGSNPELLETLCSCLHQLFRFKAATESRWLSVGHGCRVMLVGLMVGLPELARYLLDHGYLSNFYSTGFEKLANPQLREFIAIAAHSSYISDGSLKFWLEDDRVLGRLDEFSSALHEELQWLRNVPQLSWERVAVAVGSGKSAKALQSLSLHASMRGLAFLDQKIKRRANMLPFSLALGDVADNIASLAAQTPSADEHPMCASIRMLVKAGQF